MSRPDIYHTDHSDGGMDRAQREARETFKFFWREMSWEQRRIIPGVEVSAVKIAFKVDVPDADTPYEHMWIMNIQFDGKMVRGELVNEPEWVTTVARGDTVSVPLDEIEDWMYSSLGTVYGGYTVNHMRAAMRPAERRTHDKAWGLNFGDPSFVRFIETPEPPRPGLFARLMGKKAPAPEPPSDPDRTEHPMSENSRESYREQLRQDAYAATFIDDDGWTMLQRDALAGNLAPVEVFLEFGADPEARTPNGFTALDLARMMGWPNVIEALERAKK